jgi:hypothetical protein
MQTLPYRRLLNSVQKLYTEQKLVMLLYIMDNEVCDIDEYLEFLNKTLNILDLWRSENYS